MSLVIRRVKYTQPDLSLFEFSIGDWSQDLKHANATDMLHTVSFGISLHWVLSWVTVSHIVTEA